MIPKKAELSSQTLVLQDQNTPFDLSRVVQAREVFIQQIKSILELCWPASQVQTLIKCNIHPLVSEDHPYVGLFEFRISCVSLAEAVLVAEMIESSLAVMFQIKYRTSIPGLPVQFKHQNKQSKQQMAVSLFYRQEDYINGLNLVKKPHFDHEIYHVFRDSKRDYYDYWIAKKNIPDLRLMEPNRQIGGIRSTLQATAKKAIENTGEPAVLVAAHDARILAITLIGAGAGNYMHALRVINKLAEKMPKLRIDWVLADTDLPVPRLGELPPLVTVHRARGLEQLYPLIQYLSLEVDVVIGLPNNFLGFLQKKFGPNPMLLSNKCPYMVVSEYNISPNPVDPDNPLYDIELRSGMTKIPDEGLASLGIIKPERMDFPVSKEQKRQALQADSKCERMFVDHPEVPFYFAYVYTPEHKRGVDQLLGLRNVDVLAFFIQYAKSRTETQIKMVLSIRAEDIQLAKTIYPKILENCTIQLYSQQDNMRQVLSGDGVTIQVYDLFPFENITFRALSDYAVSWDTPVVMTGDQSFFELFFTNNSPVMLYQLLKHKADLFHTLRTYADKYNLRQFFQMLQQVEIRIDSEEKLLALVDFTQKNYSELQLEFQVLKNCIEQQPNLVDSLTRVVLAVIEKARQLLSVNAMDEEAAIKQLKDAFDALTRNIAPTEERKSLEECRRILQAQATQLSAPFNLKTLLTKYHCGHLLFAPFIHSPKIFANYFIRPFNREVQQRL